MSPPDTDALFGVLRAADPDVMDSDELAVLTGQIAQLKSWCDSLQVRTTRRQRTLAAEGRADDPRNTLSRHGRNSSKEAHAADERERICTAMPGFEDALNAGTVAAGHVDAIANATRNLDEALASEFNAQHDDLLTDAVRLGVDAFGRSCRELAKSLIAQAAAASDADELDRQRAASNVRRWVDQRTGMCHTHVELDPVRDRALWAAIEAARASLRRQDGNRRTPWDQLTVDAVVAAIGGGDHVDRVPEITVLIDYRTLIDGLHARGICETDNGVPLPVSTVRRLCCEAEIVPVVLGGAGQVLDVGTSKRVATRVQRRALRAMHRTCVHPDCTVTFDACRIHHVIPWQSGGPTDLDHLVPVCEPHHHLVHEGGWGLTMTADRVATWTRPDGVHHHTGSTVDRAGFGDRSTPRRTSPPTTVGATA
ncbi:MAG: HNH endonuclease [Ilumatobacteraceae bacterium]|nr:HNH endonuclease [Ilumatobacteraceae bacterium]